ncbi:hypothetical protein FOZ60_013543 [Perkinsus olseni]|uniref:SWIM-type domain-containing protein n=1 Tax=Perkinsus olseni TaxID=32597 RepID=A0A7J6N949_PEROL|nr:hypothetical protein FOZ60_013543 [Perkinsus olseni]
MYRRALEKLPKYINREGSASKSEIQRLKHEFFEDIKTLHCSGSDTLFEQGAQLFMAKWEQSHPRLARYFKTYWLCQRATWYRGAHFVPGYIPRHNCAVEGINSGIQTGQIEATASFDVLVREVMECCEDHAWRKKEDKDHPPVNDATEAAKLAVKWSTQGYIYTDCTHRFFLIPSQELLAEVDNQETLDRVVAHYLVKFLGEGGRDWEGWGHFRDVLANVFIVDSQERFCCTCRGSKRKRRCEHSMAIELLMNDSIGEGAYQLTELLPYAPVCKGRPRIPRRKALEIDEISRARGQQIGTYAVTTASAIPRLPGCARELDAGTRMALAGVVDDGVGGDNVFAPEYDGAQSSQSRSEYLQHDAQHGIMSRRTGGNDSEPRNGPSEARHLPMVEENPNLPQHSSPLTRPRTSSRVPKRGLPKRGYEPAKASPPDLRKRQRPDYRALELGKVRFVDRSIGGGGA